MKIEKKGIIIVSVVCLIGIGAVSYVSFSNKNNKDFAPVDEITNSEMNISTIRNLDGKAKIIKDVYTPRKVVALSFEGMQDDETMEKILDLLKSYDIKSTFIITGIDSSENPEVIRKITADGHELGSGTLSNESKHMEKMSQEELIKNFSKANKIIEELTLSKGSLIKCKQTDYTDEVLEAAYSCGFEYVLENNKYLNYQSFKDYDQVKNYIKRTTNGSILSIKLDGVLDESEYAKDKNDEKPAIDKKPGIDESNDEENEIDIVKIVDWILKALNENNKQVVQVTRFADMQPADDSVLHDEKSLNETNNAVSKGIRKNKSVKKVYRDAAKQSNSKLKGRGNIIECNNTKIEYKNNTTENNNNKEQNKKVENTGANTSVNVNTNYEDRVNKVNFNELIERNNKQLAKANSYIYTIQNSLSYTFRGLSDEKALDSTLEALKSINARGTFFVTKSEIEQYPDRIKKILSYGNEIGNGGITTNSKLLNKSTEEVCKEIYEVDAMLKGMGINTKAYMPGYGYVNSNIQEAVSSLNKIDELKGYEMFTYSKSPIVTKYTNWTADQIVQNYFNTNTYLSLRKGEIVYCRLDSGLFSDSNTVGSIIKILTKNYVDNGYIHKYNNATKSYDIVQKPLGYSVVPIGDIQKNINMRYKINENPKVLRKRSIDETTKFIKNNYIGNVNSDLNGFTENEQVGIDTEGTINTNGKSTLFFTFDDWGSDVIINEILDVLNKHNVKGTFFAIAKFTDPDSDASNTNPNLLRTIASYGHDIGSHNYNHETMGIDKDELMLSLSKSYTALDKVAGDSGRVKAYFRPPTLYVSKSGLEGTFEAGYDYVVSGNISTHDYEAGSAEELLSHMEQDLQKNKGNVFVMHMNNQAYYTPEALDRFLTNNEQGKYGDVYEVARLSDYLE